MKETIRIKSSKDKNIKNQEKHEDIQSILNRFEPKKENLIQILHEVQNHNCQHYLSEYAILEVARFLNITHSEIYGVISFYTMFSVRPRGKFIIRICKSAPCEVLHAEKNIECLKKILGIDIGMTTEDGLFTLEESSCLGLCDIAPAMMINDDIYGNLNPEKIKKILKEKSL